jgi:phosphoglycerate kinase
MLDRRNKGGAHYGRGSEKIPPQTYTGYNHKIHGGGDTLQELKNLCPGVYLNGFNDPECYYFSGGGTVLKALEQGSPFKIKPVERLVKQ